VAEFKNINFKDLMKKKKKIDNFDWKRKQEANVCATVPSVYLQKYPTWIW